MPSHRTDARRSWERDYYHANKDKKKEQAARSARKRKYRLSDEQYRQLLEDQEYKCALCGQPFMDDTPHVDHCHVSEKVRGLLHGRCNRGLGHFGDTIEGLERAIAYLRQST